MHGKLSLVSIEITLIDSLSIKSYIIGQRAECLWLSLITYYFLLSRRLMKATESLPGGVAGRPPQVPRSPTIRQGRPPENRHTSRNIEISPTPVIVRLSPSGQASNVWSISVQAVCQHSRRHIRCFRCVIAWANNVLHLLSSLRLSGVFDHLFSDHDTARVRTEP